jgi:hypothetical protein
VRGYKLQKPKPPVIWVYIVFWVVQGVGSLGGVFLNFGPSYDTCARAGGCTSTLRANRHRVPGLGGARGHCGKTVTIPTTPPCVRPTA